MNLAETQRLLWDLLHGRKHPLDAFVGSPDLPAVERVAIYARMFVDRQVDALRETFPKVLAALGDEEFHRVAARYVDAHPSEDPDKAGSPLETGFQAEHNARSAIARFRAMKRRRRAGVARSRSCSRANRVRATRRIRASFCLEPVIGILPVLPECLRRRPNVTWQSRRRRRSTAAAAGAPPAPGSAPAGRARDHRPGAARGARRLRRSRGWRTPRTACTGPRAATPGSRRRPAPCS